MFEVDSMKSRRQSRTLTWLVACSLALSLLGGILLDDRAQASSNRGSNTGRDNGKAANSSFDKVTPDLRAQMIASRKSRGDDYVDIILQLNDRPSGRLNALLRSNGIKINKEYLKLDSISLQVPQSLVDAIASFPEVAFLSYDGWVRPLGGHVSETTGAN